MQGCFLLSENSGLIETVCKTGLIGKPKENAEKILGAEIFWIIMR